ncbi:putative pentatricopeptide repeat-containing protein, mitochondrial [Trifolium repens]|nr:putative pentatricopeptide repeat-containing protein, mitochondrial [Trifolium repens]
MIAKGICPDIVTFNILVDAFCKEGNVKQAINVLAVMIKEGVKPDVVTYNALMDGYCLVNQVNKALGILNTMTDKGVAPNVRSYKLVREMIAKAADNGASVTVGDRGEESNVSN